MFNLDISDGLNPSKSNLDVNSNHEPLPEKESCILIINARIRDLRALEKYMYEQKMPINKTIVAKKIGGLMKCIEYIRNH